MLQPKQQKDHSFNVASSLNMSLPNTACAGAHLQAAQLAARCHPSQRIPQRVVAAGRGGRRGT